MDAVLQPVRIFCLAETGINQYLLGMNITTNKVVKIHYTLTGDDGKVIDSSDGGEPLEYMHGYGNLIPGLERELEGKAKGDKLHADIAPRDAYGEYDEKLVAEVPRTQFDVSTPIEIGQQFQAETATGTAIVTVTKITDDTVTVDANHELAGKTLHFDVEVVDIRDAFPEELPQEPSGCSGNCTSCGVGCSGCSAE